MSDENPTPGCLGCIVLMGLFGLGVVLLGIFLKLIWSLLTLFW